MEPRSSKRRLRVLCDLRPAFSGNSGIPNETRLMFQLLVRLPGLETIGLINHPELMLARTFRRDCLAFANLDGGHKTRTFSRFVAMMGPAIGTRAKLELRARNSVKLRWLRFLTKLGIPLSLDHFDGTDFGDFLWQALFSRSLPAASFDLCRAARYAALWPSWHALQLTANPYARIDTREFDVFIAQTPWPGRVSPGTQMIVRYHDAMPAFLPHTVIQSRLHQKFHLSALQENAKSAVFACVSEFSRSQLLRLFPTLEARAKVVYDCIAEDYFPSPQDRGLVPGIIASRIDPETEPQLAPTRDRGAFYDAHLHKKDFRFVLLVSTLEPRRESSRISECMGNVAAENQTTDGGRVCRRNRLEPGRDTRCHAAPAGPGRALPSLVRSRFSDARPVLRCRHGHLPVGLRGVRSAGRRSDPMRGRRGGIRHSDSSGITGGRSSLL